MSVAIRAEDRRRMRHGLTANQLAVLVNLADGGRLVPTDHRTYRAESALGVVSPHRVQRRVLLPLHARGYVRHWVSANGYVITAAGLAILDRIQRAKRGRKAA